MKLTAYDLIGLHINMYPAEELKCMHEAIYTEEEYRKAIIRFLEICDAEPGTPEHEEALLLTKRMEDYENLSFYERRNFN